METKDFFDAARVLAGGKLTQEQVDNLNKVVSYLSPEQLSATSVSTAGIDLIGGFEGLRLAAYQDSVGIWTIGYGTIKYPNGVRVKKGDTCTKEQAVSYMQYDLIEFVNTVKSSVKVPLKQTQFDALVSLTYNIGSSAFSNSTLLKKLNAKDYAGAAAQFDVWNKAGGKVIAGLTNRRAKERKYFEQ